VNILEYTGVVFLIRGGRTLIKFRSDTSPDAGDIVVLEMPTRDLVTRYPTIQQMVVTFTNPSSEDTKPSVKIQIGYLDINELTSVILRSFEQVEGTFVLNDIPNIQDFGSVADLTGQGGTVMFGLLTDQDISELEVDIFVDIGP